LGLENVFPLKTFLLLQQSDDNTNLLLYIRKSGVQNQPTFTAKRNDCCTTADTILSNFAYVAVYFFILFFSKNNETAVGKN
jgi:hypothetical protein